jgi:tetratricopeptide (TPR) repeat protein
MWLPRLHHCPASSLALLLLCWSCGTTQSHAHGAYHDLVTELERALLASPDDAALHYKLARAHQENGEWTLTMAEVERVNRLAPGKYETGYLQGQALATGGHWLASKSVLDEFLKSHAEHAGALVQRARVLLRLEKPQEALADFRTALTLTQQATEELYLEAAATLEKCGALEEAVLTLRRGIDQHGSHPGLLVPSLELELKAKHYDEALARVEAMQKTAPRPEPWMARKAQVLTEAGRTDEARTAWSALQIHLLALPNLERGNPQMSVLLAESQKALGLVVSVPVMAPPLSSPPAPLPSSTTP